MNLDGCAPQTYLSAPGGRHRYSEASPGHDAPAVAWPPPVARQRLGSDKRRSAESALFLAGPRLGQSANPPDTHPRLRALSDVCQQRQELLGHSTFAMCFAARKRLFCEARNRAC